MLTICWAAKGGSGTTVFTAARVLATSEPALVVDLAGDVLAVLGLPDADGPGIHDWLASETPPDRLSLLEHRITDAAAVIPAGDRKVGSGSRWFELAAHLRAEPRRVFVDAGTGRPPDALLAAADESLLVTRSCYLAVRRAAEMGVAPTGVVLVGEPGRAMRPADIETSIGAPVVHHSLVDPAIARATDSGLLVSRLPSGWRRQLRRAA